MEKYLEYIKSTSHAGHVIKSSFERNECLIKLTSVYKPIRLMSDITLKERKTI